MTIETIGHREIFNKGAEVIAATTFGSSLQHMMIFSLIITILGSFSKAGSAQEKLKVAAC